MLTHLFQLGTFWVRVAVLLASLPSAGSNCFFAQRCAAGEDRVAAAIALSTAVSLATVPLARASLKKSAARTRLPR